MATIINIISGKGGTGKTLLTAVFAEMLGNAGAKVLVVDLDVFVRGLTALLYYQRNKSLKITDMDCSSVSEFFRQKGQIKNEKAFISKYSSFDVFPSVLSVVEKLNFRDVMPNSFCEAVNILYSILDTIPKDYEFIFLDSRAGYDELIAASHSVSNFSICIEEDDDISMITSKNLIAQLDSESFPEMESKQIFRIRNKTRQNVYSEDNQLSDLFFLGSIPFDTDVMNSFGTDYFWEDIGKSLYKEAAIEVWNNLAERMELSVKLMSRRISPLGSKKIDKRISMLSSKNRVLFSYGILMASVSLIFTIYSPFLWDSWYGTIFINPDFNPINMLTLLGAVLGILLILYSVIKNNDR